MKIVSTSDNRISFCAEDYKYHKVEGSDLLISLRGSHKLETASSDKYLLKISHTSYLDAIKSSKEIIEQLKETVPHCPAAPLNK